MSCLPSIYKDPSRRVLTGLITSLAISTLDLPMKGRNPSYCLGTSICSGLNPTVLYLAYAQISPLVVVTATVTSEYLGRISIAFLALVTQGM